MAERRINVYDDIEARALFNFELLLHHWGIDYCKISSVEYDFLSPTRKDTNFGACRFNTQKGLGADFAGMAFTDKDFARIGDGFTKSDFATCQTGASNSWGFNVIGLCQRIHNLPTYADAAVILRRQLDSLDQNPNFIKATKKDIKLRKDRQEAEIQEKIKIAGKMWEKCSEIEDTLGEIYLASRGIFLDAPESSMRFHPLIMNAELRKPLPTLLFKVQKEPDGPLVAIHRIYLNADGTKKANVVNPKMALGSIKGGALWFGAKQASTLCVVEGPENALSIRCMGSSSVACTINAANFGMLTIPDQTKEVVLLPDSDEAGRLACVRATDAYRAQGKVVKVKFPPEIKGKKKTDWNDVLIGV